MGTYMPYSDYSGWDHFLRDPQDMVVSASKKEWHAITHKPFVIILKENKNM